MRLFGLDSEVLKLNLSVCPSARNRAVEHLGLAISADQRVKALAVGRYHRRKADPRDLTGRDSKAED